MASSFTTWARAHRHWLAWFIAFAPALLTLQIVREYGQPSPHFDTWSFVQDYREWHEGQMPWQHFFTPHNEHPAAVGKAVFIFVMEHLRGDLSLLTLLGWLLTLVASLCVLRLSTSLWQGKPWRGPVLALVVNLSLFTLTQVESWAWEFIYQNFIPGTCLALALVCLSGAGQKALRIAAALLLAIIANHSCGTGFLVWVLLLPMLWLAIAEMGKLRWGILVAWCLVNASSMWIALHGLVPGISAAGGAATDGKLSQMLSTPLLTWQYVTLLLGYHLGNGAAMETMTLAPIVGTLALLVGAAALGAIVTSREARAKVREWLPLFLLGSYSLLAAGLICVGRMRSSVYSGCAFRYVTFTMFFVPVAALLAVYALDFALTSESRQRWLSGLRRGASVGAGVLLTLHVINWQLGYNAIRIFNAQFLSERVCMRFLDTVPVHHTLAMSEFDAVDVGVLTRYLREHQRLRHVDPILSTDIKKMKQSHVINGGRGEVHLLLGTGSATPVIRGRAEISDTDRPPHAVLITRVAEDNTTEEIVTLIQMSWPTDFFDDAWRRKLYPEHYYGFEMALPEECMKRLGNGAVKLRAYAFEQLGSRVYRIPGEMLLPVR